jgi:hypothetical protein
VVGLGQFHGVRHDDWVAGMEPAGDIRRGDEWHDFLVMADLEGSKAFAQVTVQIDSHPHMQASDLTEDRL